MTLVINKVYFVGYLLLKTSVNKVCFVGYLLLNDIHCAVASARTFIVKKRNERCFINNLQCGDRDTISLFVSIFLACFSKSCELWSLINKGTVYGCLSVLLVMLLAFFYCTILLNDISSVFGKLFLDSMQYKKLIFILADLRFCFVELLCLLPLKMNDGYTVKSCFSHAKEKL